MRDLIETLAVAAARGVEVTVITNGYDVPPLRLKWHHEEFWWGATSKFRACGLELVVVDYDGDRSAWVLRQGKKELAQGEAYLCQPYYHFDACLLSAEQALLNEVRRRVIDIRERRT